MRLSANDLAVSRRRFLLAGGSLAATLGLGRVGELLASAGDPNNRKNAGYGPLAPVRDLTTGLPLLTLPAGFVYRSFGWAGDALLGGGVCPDAHDGMGVVAADGEVITLVRNHEIVRASGTFAPAVASYDPLCAGGTVTLRYDSARGEVLTATPSLSGTLQNCAGGVTPWGSWLSCEEFVSRAGTSSMLQDGQRVLARDHGFVFEVPAEGLSNAEPIIGMGQFRHEAASVHASSGIAYLTEDHAPDAGFYRFIPRVAGNLHGGGRLQMLAVKGQADLRHGMRVGTLLPVHWVDIEHPERGIDADGGITGVLNQGVAAGGSRFTRLEGCIATDAVVYFTSTDGGDLAAGQVWGYYPDRQVLVLIYESTDRAVLDYPDNVVLSPRGGLILCQDSAGEAVVEKLHGLTAQGEVFEFAGNNVVLNGERGFVGDFRAQEWAGACFSPDGRWLFANIYRPGFSVAITGPWQMGLI